MSRRPTRTRRARRRLPAYYRTTAWLARRAAVRMRARGRCEYCGLAAMEHVHHRTYAHFGAEPLTDLMAVCRHCHGLIHRRIPWEQRRPCTAASLRAQGDRGLGHSVMWARYLRAQKGTRHERTQRAR